MVCVVAVLLPKCNLPSKIVYFEFSELIKPFSNSLNKLYKSKSRVTILDTLLCLEMSQIKSCTSYVCMYMCEPDTLLYES